MWSLSHCSALAPGCSVLTGHTVSVWVLSVACLMRDGMVWTPAVAGSSDDYRNMDVTKLGGINSSQI